MAKIAKLFQSPREHKDRLSFVAITQEKTSGRGMSVDVDEREAEKGRLNIQRQGISKYGCCQSSRIRILRFFQISKNMTFYVFLNDVSESRKKSLAKV